MAENLSRLCDAQTQSESKQSVWAALAVARKQTLLAQRSFYWESMLTPANQIVLFQSWSSLLHRTFGYLNLKSEAETSARPLLELF